MHPPAPEPARAAPGTLHQSIGLPAALFLGLGSILGTGVFVSLGLAAGIAGASLLWAILLASLLALCNAMSSAQLAAAFPVSGGTYEYGYRLLHPAAGFTAGWMFLCAKSASAATAALGFSGYLLVHAPAGFGDAFTPIVAGLTVVAITAVLLAGLRRSNPVNTLIVSITLASLCALLIAAWLNPPPDARLHLSPAFIASDPAHAATPAALLHATALMFVAYTGYGRIATMGEEVVHPRQNIPRAILLTLALCSALYLAIAAVAIATLGSGELHRVTLDTRAPLEAVAERLQGPGLAFVVALGAMTAMLGVLLNLILGLSRVALAMGRRGDLPAATARLTRGSATPAVAIVAVAGLILVLSLMGSVRLAWSFSAFTVLVYYAITNLAALRLPQEHRIYPRLVSWAGLAACLLLAWFVDVQVWVAGLALIGLGLLWHTVRRARLPSAQTLAHP